MRYRLRTLMMVLALGPPLLAGGWWTRQKIVDHYRRREQQSSKPIADFDDLIRLIQETTKPDSWDDVGGPGSVDEFRGNLSIIKDGGQTVHEPPEDEK